MNAVKEKFVVDAGVVFGHHGGQGGVRVAA